MYEIDTKKVLEVIIILLVCLVAGLVILGMTELQVAFIREATDRAREAGVPEATIRALMGGS